MNYQYKTETAPFINQYYVEYKPHLYMLRNNGNKYYVENKMKRPHLRYYLEYKHLRYYLEYYTYHIVVIISCKISSQIRHHAQITSANISTLSTTHETRQSQSEVVHYWCSLKARPSSLYWPRNRQTSTKKRHHPCFLNVRCASRWKLIWSVCQYLSTHDEVMNNLQYADWIFVILTYGTWMSIMYLSLSSFSLICGNRTVVNRTVTLHSGLLIGIWKVWMSGYMVTMQSKWWQWWIWT